MLLDEGDPTQRFRIGTRVGRDFAVFYSTRLDGTEQRWVGQWNPRGGRFTFRAIQDSEEGQIVEATDRLRFNIFPGRGRSDAASSSPLSKLDSLRFEGALPLPEEELRRAARLTDRAPLRPAAPRPGRRPRAGEAGRGGVPRRLGRREGARGPGPQGPRGARAERGGGAQDRGLLGRRRPRRERPPEGSRRLAALRLAGSRGGRARPHRAHRAAGRPPLRGDGRPRGPGDGSRDRRRAERRPGAEGHGRRRGVRGKRAAHRRRSSLRTLPKPGSREFFDALDRGSRLVAAARVAYAGLRPPARARRARAHPLRRGERTARRHHSRPRGRVLARRRADASRRPASAGGGRTAAEAARGRAVRRRGLHGRPGRDRRVVPARGVDGGEGARQPRGLGRRRPRDARGRAGAAAASRRGPHRLERAHLRAADPPRRPGPARGDHPPPRARGDPGPPLGARHVLVGRRALRSRPRGRGRAPTWR